MTRKFIVPLLATLAVMLAACSSTSPTSIPQSALTPGSSISTASTSDDNLARTDAQGSVEFVVTPLNLTSSGETLEFEVVMDTYSVELSWDLAAQSTLTTDAGLEVTGLSWPVGSGHHVEGKLAFPAKTADGKLLLEGAKILRLTIRDAGAPEHAFEWELSQ